MSTTNLLFNNLVQLIKEDGFSNLKEKNNSGIFLQVKTFVGELIKEIDCLSDELHKDPTILISVKNQKLLRSCYQIIASLSIIPCLIPGLGIGLEKRCASFPALSSLTLKDEHKHELLVISIEFFTRSYSVPVFKNIIITFHLCDYLAALIQLSFATLKKPGFYQNFTMTQDMYDKYNKEKKKYLKYYENLVNNCFQPTLIKELLVLQSVQQPSLPAFAKRVICKELSRRLLASEGLLSLIRCFIESYGIDSGFDWKKVDMICKIVAVRHGSLHQEEYLGNMCAQLKNILCLNNTHYLATAAACVLHLHATYPTSEIVDSLVEEIFNAFNYDQLLAKSSLPGTIVLTSQEIEHKLNVLHACVGITNFEWPVTLLFPNVYLLFILGEKCKNNEDLQLKLKEILLKCLENLDEKPLLAVVRQFILKETETNKITLSAEEYSAGLVLKSVKNNSISKKDLAIYFLYLFKASTNQFFIQAIFKILLNILTELSKRQLQIQQDPSHNSLEDEVKRSKAVEDYANVLHILTEVSTIPRVVSCLQNNPLMVLEFIEHYLTETEDKQLNDDCISIALALLNVVLSNVKKNEKVLSRVQMLLPVLYKMVTQDLGYNTILCKEAISLILSGKPQQVDSKCERAVSDVYDPLLPVRAHGIMELTKLIEQKDPETLSKKHYIFCLFQEHLKDDDSYMYLSCINGIASLGTHCTEDVLHVLCKEFLQMSNDHSLNLKEDITKEAELRMKIGDIIVKVTQKLGEMAVVYKTILLNTMLCGCRDSDPMIRTSALSNLAEIALVLNYKIGTIIYEVLLCIWSIIETDKAVECKRAAVMVISSLLRGLGADTLVELKENLLPIYRTLKNLYRDEDEDKAVRLHAQLALEELNYIVNTFLYGHLKIR